jgi:hypothetical protein
MTRERAKMLLPIIQAYAEGKVVEYRITPSSPWRFDYHETQLSFCDKYDYRIKPEPREWTLVFDENGMFRFYTESTLDYGTVRGMKAIKVREVLDES